MDARSGMSSRNDNADKNGLAGVTTPTWAPTGAPPEVLVINGRVTDIPLWRARKRRERNPGRRSMDRALQLDPYLWYEVRHRRCLCQSSWTCGGGSHHTSEAPRGTPLHRPLGDRVRGWDRNQHRDSIWRVSNHYHEQAVA